MLFSKKKGKQHLNMHGNLVLTKNVQLVGVTVPSAMPHLIQGGGHAYVRKGSKIAATLTALNFIWGK
jgi:hypothetical protein